MDNNILVNKISREKYAVISGASKGVNREP
jgi:hypothetical protein